MNSCASCKHARMACNEDYVGCALWAQRTGRTHTPNEIMEELNLDSLATGWAYLGRFPDQKDISPGTLGTGIMTNGIVCFKKDFVCGEFDVRDSEFTYGKRNTNTNDIVEVVRCKDCKLRDTEDCPFTMWDCGELMGETEDDDFCSHGIKKN